jgi:dTDP-4-dehydrorhamnose reductase
LVALRRSGHDAYGTYQRYAIPGLLPVDIRSRAAVGALVERLRPQVVLLPAALTHVDRCETHPEESIAVNVAPARCLAETGLRLVFFSSDYVFAGDAGPYRETDVAAPANVYGRHKLLAEEALPTDALIARTTVVYGVEAQQKNFVYRLLSTLGAGNTLDVPIDQIGSPTYAPNLADAAVHLIDAGARGIYHIAGPDRVDRYEFARAAARVFGLDEGLLRPVETRDLGQPARRPLDAGLVSDKAQALLPFPLIGYEEGLRRMRETLASTREPA